MYEYNVTGDLSLQKLLQVTKNAEAHVTKKDWEGICKHTETGEKQCWEGDGIISKVIDLIVINLNPGSSGSDSDCEVSEPDTDCCKIMPDEDSDWDLAQLL
jgi:hypothetical protein